MYIIGIDPGLNGAVFLLSTKDRDSYINWVMPRVGDKMLDLTGLNEIFEYIKTKHKPVTAYLEKVHAMPSHKNGKIRQGVSSMFKFGRVYGILEGMIVSHNIPYELVTPQRWQKEMHMGIEKEVDSKHRSRLAVQRLFPQIDLRKSDRCRNPHDGLVDALLIAEYGRRAQSKSLS